MGSPHSVSAQWGQDPPVLPCPPCWLPQRREKPSIHQLVERFLVGLQEEFPSTISTVYRYGGVFLGVWRDWGAPTHPVLAAGPGRS